MFAFSPAQAAEPETLPAPVRQQVDSGLSAWTADGDAGKAAASIADLCALNPGIAPDIVAYAGEAAARANAPQRCALSAKGCDQLDTLLGLLYDQAMRVAGRDVSSVAPTAPRGGSGGTSPGGGIVKPTPPSCVATRTCGTEPAPTSQTRL